MSYILDALKKSEEQRNNGKAVAPSYHAQPRPLRKTKYYFFPVTITIILALFVIAGFYFFENKKNIMPPSAPTEETIIERQTINAPTAPIAAKEPAQPGLINNKPPVISKPTSKRSERKLINDEPFNDEFTSFNKQGKAQSRSQPVPTPVPVPAPAPVEKIEKETSPSIITRPENIANLYESPSYLKNQVPALDYSSHWHDLNPEKCVIIINNKSYREGSWINNKVKIEKILPDETIFKIGNDKFKLNSLQNWGT